MAAVLLYFYAAFVVLAGFLFPTSRCANYRCPTQCSCLGSMVDCSKRGLSEIPADIPHWVTILELQSNELNTIPANAFHGLDRLEQLDLSNNKFVIFNGTSLTNLPSLTELKLAYNELLEIPILPGGSNITSLILNHNQISTIVPEPLENLPKLRTLDLNYNDVTQLTSGSFPRHPSLHQLFLNNNKIGVLEKGALDNLTSIEWIKLNKNKLHQFPKNVFANLGKLKYLELNRNKLRSIEGLAFQGLTNLTTLKLRRNAINELMDGAFWGLQHNLQNLQLDHNNITSVTKGWLYKLSSLQQLSLTHNRISRIDPDSWDFCQQLWELDLSHNDVAAINEGTFSKLKALKVLLINNNHISFIGVHAFAGLTALQILEMNNNEISWTIEDMSGAFDGLEALSRLELDSNRIKSIGKRAFSGLDQLQHLHLNNNAINSIQSNAFSHIPSLRELRLNSTNLLCDCQLSWLPKWLKDAGFQETVDGRCAHPDSLKGRSIFEIAHEDFKCSDFPRPIIMTDPLEQVVLWGENVTLHCQAASSLDSPMTAQWKKDNILLEDSEIQNFATTSDGKITKFTSLLHMRHISDEAEGTYQCVISNGLGSTYSQKASITVHVYPTFTKVPKDVTVRAGTAARLECAAHGLPQPEIAWQKDGGDDFPAARERRMHVMPDDEVFFIVSVKSSDQGVYSCMATNAAGTVIANASVQVLETPAFVKKMEDKMAEEGTTAVLECLASGSPKPRLEWKKDGEPLVVSNRHFFTADNQLLIIVQTRPSDTGKYTCVMTNTLGTDRGTSNLKVNSLHPHKDEDGGHLDDESTTTGIIIIAVVCCVVGTSLVWVIIIYQTRKKTEEYSSTPTDETTLPGEGPGTPYHASDRDSRSSPGPLPPPHLSTSFTKYQGVDLTGHESFLGGRTRMAAMFPSDMDDDDHRQSVPLTSDEQQLAETSDNSITALHRVTGAGGSDCDTEHSASPSSRSTHSTGLLYTFHPSPADSRHHIETDDSHTAAAAQLDHPPIAVVHATPVTQPQHDQRFTHSSTERLGHEAHHGTRPPDGGGHEDERCRAAYQDGGSASDADCSSYRASPIPSVSKPVSHSLPLPPRLPKDPHVSSRPPPPVPPQHNQLHPSHHQAQHHHQHHHPQQEQYQPHQHHYHHHHPHQEEDAQPETHTPSLEHHPHHPPVNTPQQISHQQNQQHQRHKHQNSNSDISLANQSEPEDCSPSSIPERQSSQRSLSSSHIQMPHRTS